MCYYPIKREEFLIVVCSPVVHSLIESEYPDDAISPGQAQFSRVGQLSIPYLVKGKLTQLIKNSFGYLIPVGCIPPVVVESAGLLGIISL